MSLISMICLLTPFTPVSLSDENFMIRVLASTLSEVVNCLSIALSNAQRLVHCSIEQQIPNKILIFMKIALRQFNRSHCSLSTFSPLVLVSVIFSSSFLMHSQCPSIPNKEEFTPFMFYNCYHSIQEYYT